MMGDVPSYPSQNPEIAAPIMMEKQPTPTTSPHAAEAEPEKESISIESGQEHFMPVFEQNEGDGKMKKPAVPQIRNNTKKSTNKPLPDFNEAFGSTERGRFQSPPDPRLAPNKDILRFPLSSQNFCASSNLFSNDLKYQNNYILEYFQSMPSMTLMNITTPNGTSFPYATYSPLNLIDNINNETQVFENVTEPNFFHTDVGFVPMSSL
ncbi:uncharacterized protein BDFB_004477, partial [Asbolus verrucosus]